MRGGRARSRAFAERKTTRGEWSPFAPRKGGSRDGRRDTEKPRKQALKTRNTYVRTADLTGLETHLHRARNPNRETSSPGLPAGHECQKTPPLADAPRRSTPITSPGRRRARTWRGSMPLGNGDIGLNVWVEKNWVTCCSKSQQDRRLERQRWRQQGTAQARPHPRELCARFYRRQTHNFRQEIALLRDGESSSPRDRPTPKQWCALWVDLNRPVVQA